MPIGSILSATLPKSSVRRAAAAGLFYPRDADGLRRALGALLAQCPATRSDRAPKALIAPHAGYAYSGNVAAAAYCRLLPFAASVRHVVVLGPSHRVPIRGLAMPSCDFFATPCGEVPIDDSDRRRLRELGLAGVSDAAHAAEHSIEVQVPFLQFVLRDFDLLPVAVGQVTSEQVAHALQAVWGCDDTLVVVSTDLSHHHTCGEARLIDAGTSRAIVERRSDLSDEQACGAACVNGLMEVARLKGLCVERLALRSSGDQGDADARVVGYGSFALYPS